MPRHTGGRLEIACTEVLAEDPTATMTEIAQASGLVRATLSRHVPTREELLVAICRDALERSAQAIVEAEPMCGPAPEALTRVIAALGLMGDRYRVIGSGTSDSWASTMRRRSGSRSSSAPPAPNPAKDTATFTVFPTSKPQAPATPDLLTDLRENVFPPLAQQTGITANIGGSTATTADLDSSLSSKLPLFILVVVGPSLLLVVHDGDFASLLGAETTGPIEAFLPVWAWL